ncbi:MAG TPA: tRNA pseudouridine(13) synthase TruD, partial [Gemmataceae bacterium]|nr:tRNA pseudouridine(13) synthase TruD [Gemmataceae bacterium]
MSIEAILAPPLLTADLPGIGGRIKSVPEDFEVEEIPAYEPSGSGEFLYLWIEKRDMGAEYFVRQVAKRLDIPVGEVGTAGMKDRHAVTRQMVSVPGQVEDRLGQLEGDGIRVLKISRHGNKLRPGHLHGNHFNILVRDPLPGSEQILQPLLERLQAHGLPNFYGPQRFGHDGETLHQGLALLRGKKPPLSATGRVPNLRSPFLRKLALSAVQSGLFNHYLAERMNAGLLRRVLPGDAMAKVPFGGMFVAEDVAREQERFDAGETVPAGPIFGRKTFPAAGEAAAREQETLRAFNLSPSSFAGFGKLMQGTRRHNLVALTNLSAAM